MDLLIVGSGLFGLTIAERAAESGLKVTVIDKRNHFGGNAYSYTDPSSKIIIHKYGSHIFHTSSKLVWDYVNRFTAFNGYIHKVYTNYNDQIYPMPINLGTINQFFKASLSPTQARELINGRRIDIRSDEIQSLEEKAVSLIGRELYEAFIKGYTKKQWQMDPSKLPSEIITRLPIRFNYNNDYFDDLWQGIPNDGYDAWFARMLDHKNITLKLESDFFDPASSYFKNRVLGQIPVVYTGKLDQYFDYCAGDLNWRTLDFELQTIQIDDFQGNTVINYANEEVPYTRIHEFKHFHPEKTDIVNSSETIIMREYSRYSGKNDEPFYPINSRADRDLLSVYRELQMHESQVYFGGRLGSYKYLDMHMAVASALTLWNNRIAGAFKIG